MRGRKKGPREVPAAEAAVRLGMSRERLVRLIQNGQLAGRRDPRLGWLVGQASLDGFNRRSEGRSSARPGGRHG